MRTDIYLQIRRPFGRLVWLFGCLALGYASVVQAADPAVQARKVIDQADMSYSISFTWDCSAATWESILDQPLLMAALWAEYGFAPAYRVSAREDLIHVDDPTGIVGDALLFHRATGERSYWVQGKLDHWAAPFFNEGMAVFVLTSTVVNGQVIGNLQVYIRAQGAVGSVVLTLARSLLAQRVDNRVTLNLEDARTIVEAIDADPLQVAARLRGAEADRFRRIFSR